MSISSHVHVHSDWPSFVFPFLFLFVFVFWFCLTVSFFSHTWTSLRGCMFWACAPPCSLFLPPSSSFLSRRAPEEIVPETIVLALESFDLEPATVEWGLETIISWPNYSSYMGALLCWIPFKTKQNHKWLFHDLKWSFLNTRRFVDSRFGKIAWGLQRAFGFKKFWDYCKKEPSPKNTMPLGKDPPWICRRFRQSPSGLRFN